MPGGRHTRPYHQRAPQALLEGKKRNDQKASTRTRCKRHARGPLQPIPSLQAGTAGPKDTGGRPNEGQSDTKGQMVQYLPSQVTQGMGSTTWMKYKECNSWIRAGTFTSGEAIDAILLRSNCILTRECISRYKPSTDTKCRRCGMATETSGHISGWCPTVKCSRSVRSWETKCRSKAGQYTGNLS